MIKTYVQQNSWPKNYKGATINCFVHELLGVMNHEVFDSMPPETIGGGCDCI